MIAGNVLVFMMSQDNTSALRFLGCCAFIGDAVTMVVMRLGTDGMLSTLASDLRGGAKAILENFENFCL